MNEIATRQETVPEAADVRMLARELAASYRSSVDHHRRKLGLPAAEAVALAEEPLPAPCQDDVLAGEPEYVHWWGLEDLARTDPELALHRWQELKAEAREELRSGHRAATAMEGYASEPWQRARFLAIREELAGGWQPRNGVERQLIDQMAQAQTATFFWQERLMLRASVERSREKRDVNDRGGWSPPRVSEHQAVEQAGAMVDRFNRIFLRTLRALRDLRRYATPVIVHNAGQVNVGSRQVNVSV